MGGVNRLFVRDINTQQMLLVGCRTLGIGAVEMEMTLTVYCAVFRRASQTGVALQETLFVDNQENRR